MGNFRGNILTRAVFRDANGAVLPPACAPGGDTHTADGSRVRVRWALGGGSARLGAARPASGG